MQDIESDMRNLVAEIIEKAPSEIKSDDRLVEDLGVDSMMALEILAGIEKKYKITIPEEKLAEFITLGSIIAIAKEYLSTNA